MAVLQPPGEREPIALAAHTLVGRGTGCLVRLAEPRASTEHAAFSWRDGRWWIRDLGSRNGTTVSGDRLVAGQATAIDAGAPVVFGAGAPWIFADESEPGPVAIRLGDGRVRGARGGGLCLPEPDAVEADLMLDGGAWCVEGIDGARQPAVNGQVIMLSDGGWRLWLPEGPVATVDAVAGAVPLAAVSMHFAVSRDEEYVELVLRHGDVAIELAGRAHHYLLLTLARLRLADVHLPHFDQGWVHHDDLQTMLGVGRLTINTQVSRARRMLADRGIVGAPSLIERRPGPGTLRIGVAPDRLRVGR